MTQPQFKLWEQIKKEEKENVLRLQKKYCELHQVPCFIGDWTCVNCDAEILFYITEREAAIKHITACPMCQWSLCE